MASLKSSTFKNISISTTYKDTTNHRVDLTLANSWVDYDTTYWGPARVVKINNVVYVVGLIKNGTTTDGTLVTTLPVGYRPTGDGKLLFPGYYSSTSAECRLDVRTNGEVIFYSVASAAYLSLNSIIFCV